MNRIFYDGIELRFIDTREIGRTVVRDRASRQYLYTEWLFDVVCQYNPEITTYTGALGGLVAPVFARGKLPAITDVALRHKLMQPRKTLVYLSAAQFGGPDNVVLRCPVSGASSDAAWGPFPEECTVLQTHGMKTWIVHFRIRCRVRECPTQNSPIALAHSWRVFADTDQDYFTTRVIEGEVVFDTQRLLSAAASPDDFRREFFHSCPMDMKREKVEVSIADDGSRCNYRLVDRETAFMLGATAACTRCEAYQTSHLQEAGLTYATGNLLLDLIPAGVGALLGAVPLVGGGLAPGAERIAGAVVNFARVITPHFTDTIMVRTWGHKNSTRRDLTQLALAVATHRIGDFRPEVQSELIVSQQLDGKFAEVQLTHHSGPEAVVDRGLRVFDGGGGILRFAPRFLALFGNESVEDGGSVLFRTAAVGSPLPPNHGGTRGTWLGRMVSSALHETCYPPPAPGLVGTARHSTWT